MLKLSKLTLLFILLYTSVFAAEDEEFPFIGFNVSTQSINLFDENTRETDIGIRYGHQTLDLRTFFSYEYSKGYQSLSMEIDKILVDEFFNTSKIRPYLGVSVGVLQLEDKTLTQSNGSYVGASLGLIVYATDRVDIDLSYHYNMIQNIQEADQMHGATLALHYFF